MRTLGAVLSTFDVQIRRSPVVYSAVLFVLLVIGFPLALLLYVARIRLLQLTAHGRIGHLCIDPTMFVRRQLLGLDPRYYGVLISPPRLTANESLLNYWRSYMTVVRADPLAKFLHALTRYRFLVYDARTAAINGTGPQIAVERAWGDRPALMRLTAAHRRRGREWLAAMGVPADARFVCFHNREPGYAPHDDAINTYRNSDIRNYLPAVAELRKRGFWCVRMGHPSMAPLAPMEGVIDYAHHADRADWLDVYLCADSTFFLGASSGLLFVADLFGTPCAPANQAPLSSVLAFGARDVAIPKLVWSEREGRYLSFAEVFRSDVASFRLSHLFKRQRLRAVENSPEDVRDLALEMLERSQGCAAYAARDEELQRRFKALMRPGHYSYGGVNRVGRDFLRKYEHLMGD
jgi:putative glycosyltransferase (TIGR04372 family)